VLGAPTGSWGCTRVRADGPDVRCCSREQRTAPASQPGVLPLHMYRAQGAKFNWIAVLASLADGLTQVMSVEAALQRSLLLHAAQSSLHSRCRSQAWLAAPGPR
jgi:hypothetical protein